MIEELLEMLFGERLLKLIMLITFWAWFVYIFVAGVRAVSAESRAITINTVEVRNPYLPSYRATQLKDIARSFLLLHGVRTREGFSERRKDPFAADRELPEMLEPSEESVSWYLSLKKKIKPFSILSVVTPPSTFDGHRYISGFSLKNALVGGFANVQCNEFNSTGANRMIYCLITMIHEWLHNLGCSHDNGSPLSIMNEDALSLYVNDGILPPIGAKCLKQVRRAQKRWK